jgi:hypothetical protein
MTQTRTWTLVVVLLSGVALGGCQKRGARGPTTAPQASPAQAAVQPQPPQPPAPAPVKTTRFAIGTDHLNSPILEIRVNGPIVDTRYGEPYAMEAITNVQGQPPQAAPYYLFNTSHQRQRSSGGGTGSVIAGPFFTEKLPPGTRLTNLTPIGSFRAKSKGFLSPDIGVQTMTDHHPYTLFQATVEGP